MNTLFACCSPGTDALQMGDQPLLWWRPRAGASWSPKV